LDSSLNSNWKVIDHELPKCIGIWRFVGDDFTRKGLCNAWLQVYLDGGPFQNVAQLIEEKTRDEACESTRNMANLRRDLQELLRLETAGDVRELKDRCDNSKDFQQFRLVPTALRADAATQARLRGVRLSSEGVIREPTDIGSGKDDASGEYVFSNEHPMTMSFALPVSVTDFSFQLSSNTANAGEDPVAFELHGLDGTTNTLLLDFKMDDVTKQITSLPTSVRRAWSPGLGLIGGAEGFSWNDERGLCQRRAKCFSIDCRLVGPFGFVNPKEAQSFCSGDTCADADREKCCSDAQYSTRFTLVMTQTLPPDSYTFTAIAAKLKGVTSAGVQYDSKNWTNMPDLAEGYFFLTNPEYTWRGTRSVPLLVPGNQKIKITQLCLSLTRFAQNNNDLARRASTLDLASVKIVNNEGPRPVEVLQLTGWTRQGPLDENPTDHFDCKPV